MKIGIDLGGTKIEAIVLSDNGQVLFRERVATPAGNYAATLDCITGLVGRAEAHVPGRCTVGVGIPGAKSPDHGQWHSLKKKAHSLKEIRPILKISVW
ncbi:MAG: ROK family protein [Pseudomonadota bacterium]